MSIIFILRVKHKVPRKLMGISSVYQLFDHKPERLVPNFREIDSTVVEMIELKGTVVTPLEKVYWRYKSSEKSFSHRFLWKRTYFFQPVESFKTVLPHWLPWVCVHFNTVYGVRQQLTQKSGFIKKKRLYTVFIKLNYNICITIKSKVANH